MDDDFLQESPDSRADFNETWLAEMPERLGTDVQTYEEIVRSIKARVQHGYPVVVLGDGLRKIEGVQVVYYWYGDDPILLAAEFTKRRQALVVNMVGKLSMGSPPYAADLYDAVLKDRKAMGGETVSAIRLQSDDRLSDEGLAVWKRLFAKGHKISVYDRDNPGTTFKTISSVSDLDAYMGDQESRRYQFVLSEHSHLMEIVSFFNTRRYRELSGLL